MYRVQFNVGQDVHVNKEKIKEIKEFYHNVDDTHMFKDMKFIISDNKLEDIELDDYVGEIPDDNTFVTLLSEAITSSKIVVYYIKDGEIQGYVVRPNKVYDVSITATYTENGETIEVELPTVL